VELKFFLMADYASISADQKLSINGIFQNINALQFPTTHPVMYLVAQLQAGPAEYGRTFTLQIKLLGEDADVLTELSGKAIVPTPPVRGASAFVNNVIQLVNVVFPKPGRYQFSLLINDDQKGELEFELNQVSPQATNVE
jgi:hypothetical protein